jgi:hypothetical protein
MSKGLSWCPASLFSMPLEPSEPSEPSLIASGDGSVQGRWRLGRVDSRMQENLVWNGIHPLIQRFLQDALNCPESCRLLAERGTGPVGRALLVKNMHEEATQRPHCYQYVGAVYFRPELVENGWDEEEVIISGGGKGVTSDPQTRLRRCTKRFGAAHSSG